MAEHASDDFALEKQHLLSLAARCLDHSRGLEEHHLQKELERAYRKSSQATRSDHEVAVAVAAVAVDRNPWAFEDLSARLRDDESLALLAVRRCSSTFQYASPRLRGTKNIALEVVRGAGFMLEYASKTLQADEEVVGAAIDNAPLAVSFASPHLRKSKSIILRALRSQLSQGGYSRNPLEYLDPELRDREMIFEGSKHAGDSLRFASLTLRQDKDFALLCARHAPIGKAAKVYSQVDECVSTTISQAAFVSAAEAFLACRGEEAPTLTCSRMAFPNDVDKEDTNNSTFEVYLLSGRNFQVTLTSSKFVCGEGEGEEARRFEPTINDLAREIVAELSRQAPNLLATRGVFICIANDADEAVVLDSW
eukprot:CAMPEP_0206499666 /NCGR_PEP_ID=MMETSP0324_2-20121206/51882_1 /ASSEMBLY_ACC=CAM_ASM_000836 /TAXON_ID=2866 /ORGANISM="Crypthecodinium cohnii, Strain Seligo" /LENGTH=365 /DNA_ID=CAMNT_0053986401 /DNA_START=37 /DNA_END=1131 /DNA_ORIENTATION=+